AVSPPSWHASFHHQMPPEIVAGLTTALARDWAEADDGDGRFLHRPSMYLDNSIQPLTDAGWTRRASKANTIEFVAPDGQAGVFVNNRRNRDDDEAIVLWAGPPGYDRAKAYFSAGTPSHLIAATAAALSDPAPLTRERHMINRSV
ncbi:DUF317 domain-containing protein, partial [Streptomyces sp. SID11233]|nr:DUF317 domain-containing protein [Streptomyces sp. SID11233]